jgi:hypothetical protein
VSKTQLLGHFRVTGTVVTSTSSAKESSMIRIALVGAALAAGLLTACGAAAEAGGTPNTAVATSTASMAGALSATEGAPAPKTAEQITTELAVGVPTSRLTQVYTAETDREKLLGTPGGYTSKTAFSDRRVPVDQLEGLRDDAIEVGGSVEVFADQAAATARRQHIAQIGQQTPTAFEYLYQSGNVLVRVSSLLTPEEAADYDDALKAAIA